MKNGGCESAIEPIIFMINKVDLSWVPNFIALGIYFIFGTKFSWNEEIDTCFNVKSVLLGRNYDFQGGYCSLPSGYWWLLLVTASYWSFPLLVCTIRNPMLKESEKKTDLGFLQDHAVNWLVLG